MKSKWAIVGLLLFVTGVVIVSWSVPGKSLSKSDEELNRVNRILESIGDVNVGLASRDPNSPEGEIKCALSLECDFVDFTIPKELLRIPSDDLLKIELNRQMQLALEAHGLPPKKIRLTLSNTSPFYRPKQDIKLDMVLTGPGTKTVTGPRASLVVACGAFKVPWQRHSVGPVAEESLKTVTACEERRFSITIQAPDKPGEYSLYAIFELFADEEGNAWVTEAAYSDTKLLRVVW